MTFTRPNNSYLMNPPGMLESGISVSALKCEVSQLLTGEWGTQYKRHYGDVQPTYSKISLLVYEWPLIRKQNLVYEWVNFYKFEPKLAQILKIFLEKSGDFAQNLTQNGSNWYINGSLFLEKKLYLYGSTFKFRVGTSLPKPKLSTPVGTDWLTDLHDRLVIKLSGMQNSADIWLHICHRHCIIGHSGDLYKCQSLQEFSGKTTMDYVACDFISVFLLNI